MSKDGIQTLGYNVGLVQALPKMGRYTFGEKVEYWAVIWGTVIMSRWWARRPETSDRSSRRPSSCSTPGSSPTSGRLIFRPAGLTTSTSTLTWTLSPGQMVTYDDVVADMLKTGLGSLDVFVSQGAPIPVIQTRIFDDAGVDGTTGFTEPFYRTTDVPTSGTGYLIGPSDVARFRYNIGIRTLQDGVAVTATVRNSNGSVSHVETNHYDQPVFLQTSASSFLGVSLRDDQSIQLSYSGGGVIIYGATVDNVTNDSSAQFMTYGTAVQTAQAKPARSSSATPILFAALLAALGAAIGAVVIKR